jgi:hypothetical protein
MACCVPATPGNRDVEARRAMAKFSTAMGNSSRRASPTETSTSILAPRIANDIVTTSWRGCCAPDCLSTTSEMKARDVMGIVKIGREAGFEQARLLMAYHGIHHLLAA